MKNALTLSIFFLLSIPVVQSQVLEETRVMSIGSKPSLTIVLPGADTKVADAVWKEYMKPYGKVTKVKQSKEYIVSDVQILDIGGVNRLNVYSLSEEVADGAKMVIWFDMGPDFISSETYPKEYVAGVKFLKDYAQRVKVDMITTELEEQEKVLSKVESNFAKLQRENENLHRIIEDSKKRIAQAEEDIEKNLKEQEVTQKEIEMQKNALEGVQKKLEECKNQ